MDLRGKVAIVTGSATGIGRSTALALAEKGCNVAVNWSRSEAEAGATAASLEKCGVEALVIRGDVSSDAECRRIVDAAAAKWNRVDIVVNNAATTVFVPHRNLSDLDDQMWDRVFAVNVKGAFFMARAAAELLRKTRGVIVNVSSAAAANGGGSSIPYAASKAALNSLTMSLAKVLAPEIRVNAVAPGFVDTRWLAEGYGERLDAMRSMVKQQTPLREAAGPDHVARAILALITGMDFVTGQVVVVDGGYSIR